MCDNCNECITFLNMQELNTKSIFLNEELIKLKKQLNESVLRADRLKTQLTALCGELNHFKNEYYEQLDINRKLHDVINDLKEKLPCDFVAM